MSQKIEMLLLCIGVIVIILVYCVLLFDLAFPIDPEEERIANEKRVRSEKRVEYHKNKLKVFVKCWRIKRVIGGDMMTQHSRDSIAEALNNKGATKPCERCGSSDFVALEGYYRQEIQSDMQNVSLGGPNTQTVAMGCNNCGNMSFFAVNVLFG